MDAPLLDLIGSDLLPGLRDLLEKQRVELQTRFGGQRTKWRQEIEMRQRAVRAKMMDPEVVRFRDKLTFVLGAWTVRL